MGTTKGKKQKCHCFKLSRSSSQIPAFSGYVALLNSLLHERIEHPNRMCYVELRLVSENRHTSLFFLDFIGLNQSFYLFWSLRQFPVIFSKPSFFPVKAKGRNMFSQSRSFLLNTTQSGLDRNSRAKQH